MAARAKAFGFRLLASDLFVERTMAERFGVTLVSLDELLRQADIVSVHAPLTQETFHLLGEREFALMKSTAYVVNTARGAVIDQAALIGHCRGVATRGRGWMSLRGNGWSRTARFSPWIT